jgi:hypothetical protein
VKLEPLSSINYPKTNKLELMVKVGVYESPSGDMTN